MKHAAGHSERPAVRAARHHFTAAQRILLALGVLAGLSGCQTRTQQRDRVRALQLTDKQGYLDFIASRRVQEQQSKVSTGDTKSTETTFQESVGLEVMGYSYHPNLLEFTAAGVFGLIQHEFDEVAAGFHENGRDSGPVLEFDLAGNFLKKKKYPGMAYARRKQGLEPRLFRSAVETTATEYGLQWQYLSERAPTSIQFNYTDVQLDPLSTQEEDSRRTDTDFRLETGYNFSDYSQLELLYEHKISSERPYALDFDSDELTLSHRHDFGEQHRDRLDSELNYFVQKGTFDIERLRWREKLRLVHSDRLQSSYRFEAIDRTRGSLAALSTIHERSYYVSGRLEHRLYQSLVSQLHGFAQLQDYDSGANINRYGIDGSLDYRKSNPWGILRANYRAALEREKRSGGAVNAEIRDAQHAFQDPNPITLNNPNIAPGSIVITAMDGITYYQLGSDYLIRRLGNRVEIERVLGGRIADGETVLIDYVFDLGGNFTLDTLSQNFAIRQEFGFGLSPYYRLRRQDQSVSPVSTTSAVPDDITAHVLGADYRWGTFRIGVEYEHHDSTINPFKAARFNGGYSHRFKSGGKGNVRFGWQKISYGFLSGRETRYFSVEGRYRHPITRRLTFEGAVLYRDGDDTLSGPNRGFDVDLSIEWFIRRTELRVSYDFGQFDDQFARNDSSTFFFQIRRRF